MLDKEYKYFKDHQQELLSKYKGKVLVIRGEEIVGSYDDEVTAYNDSAKKYEVGTFLVQKCVPDEETVQSFHSRVVFK